jgi:hypothetical protein
MNIHVLFFGAARDAVEANQLDLELEAPATVSSAFQSLKDNRCGRGGAARGAT